MKTRYLVYALALALATVLASGCAPQKGDKGADGQVAVGPAGPQGPQGATGNPGAPGTPGVSPVLEIIDPCGDGIGYDEVILRLGPTKLVAYYENGAEHILAVLLPGTYATSDSQHCVFVVHTDGSVTW